MIVKLYSPIGPPGVRLDGLIYYFAGGVGMPNGPVWALLASLKLQYWDGTAWQDFFPAVSDSQLSANVVILTAGVYPAGDGSLITNLPPPVPGVYAGGSVQLDGAGQATFAVTGSTGDGFGNFSLANFAWCLTSFPYAGQPVAAGIIQLVSTVNAVSVTIQSSLGAVDANCWVFWSQIKLI